MSIQSAGFARAAIRGTVWRYLAFFSGKLMVLVSTLVLARLLSKDDFGVVGFAITTISFLDVMSDLGVAPALIFHEEDERTANTAFWLGIGFGACLTAITWLSAPLVGAFFQDPRAVPVTRVLSLSYLIAALGNTHEAVQQKKLAFGKNFVPDFFRSLAKGVVSIALAYLGIGAWSLIGGQLGGVAVGAVMFWVVSRWRPSFSFDLQIAKSLVGYGMKIVSVDLLAILLNNIDYLLVGRYLGAEMLGVYTLAFRLPDLLILQFARILSGVIFPIYTRMREVPGSLGKGFSTTTRYVSLLTLPVGVGLSMIAQPFVLVAFTGKWLDAVPVIRAISIYAVFLSLAYNAGSVYKAEGRPQVLTYLGLFRLTLVLPAIYWAAAVEKSIVAVGWVQAGVALASGMLNLVIAARLIKLPLSGLLDSLRPALLSTLVLAICVQAALMLTSNLSASLQLLISVTAGGLGYLLSLMIFQRDLVYSAGTQLRSALGKI